VQGMISALVAAGLANGYLVSPRLKEVHWLAAGRERRAPRVSVAGESALLVDAVNLLHEGARSTAEPLHGLRRSASRGTAD
jgi:hypothetical protein